MLEYDEAGDTIDLFVMISWTGLSSSGDEGIEGVPALPTKRQYHAGGLDLKCEKVHDYMDAVIRRDLERVNDKWKRWLESNIGTN